MNDKIYTFSEGDATKYGLNAAIILQHIRWWVAKNEANEKHQYDGRTWTYNSARAFKNLFPFLSEDQIRRALERLVREEVLITGNYNKSTYDRTKWYALKCQLHLAPVPNGFGTSAEPIPVNKPLSICGGKAATGRDGENGFGMVSSIKTDASEFDLRIAELLLGSVRRHLGTSHPIPRKAKLPGWADHIRLLREVDGTEVAAIEQAAAWYAENIGGEYVPEAFSAKGFRQKFHAIERQCKRDVVAITEVGPEAVAIAECLRDRGWPKGSEAALPAVIQSTMTEYKAFQQRVSAFVSGLRSMATKGTPITRLLRFGEYIMDVMPSPAHFTRVWVEAIHKRIVKWEDWNGQLAPMAFKPDHARFRSMGRGWAVEYANDPDRWDDFIEAMKEAV